jgi:hypothetical protein
VWRGPKRSRHTILVELSPLDSYVEFKPRDYSLSNDISVKAVRIDLDYLASDSMIFCFSHGDQIKDHHQDRRFRRKKAKIVSLLIGNINRQSQLIGTPIDRSVEHEISMSTVWTNSVGSGLATNVNMDKSSTKNRSGFR